MKVLHVCSGNNVRVSEFISEQVASLRSEGVYADYFLIEGKGLLGYLSTLPRLSRSVRTGDYDLVHAHFGLSGMLAVLQRHRPVVISFIGEMNFPILRAISKIAMRMAAYSILVSEELQRKAGANRNFAIIPYGVDLNTFFPRDKSECRRALGLNPDAKIALFASSSDRPEKNYPLARDAVRLVDGLTLLPLSHAYERHDVSLLFNACDLLLLTSTREGSPQVIKEAMACNLPIVSTGVGDVKKVIADTEGCYITSFQPHDIAQAIVAALSVGRTDGRNRLAHLSIGEIAHRVIAVYEQVLANEASTASTSGPETRG